MTTAAPSVEAQVVSSFDAYSEAREALQRARKDFSDAVKATRTTRAVTMDRVSEITGMTRQGLYKMLREMESSEPSS